MKRITGFFALCTALMVLCVFPATANAEAVGQASLREAVGTPDKVQPLQTSASGIIASGVCGTCPWVIDGDGTLMISSGTLQEPFPWYKHEYNGEIIRAEIIGNVQAIDSCARMFKGVDYGNLNRGSPSYINLQGLDTSRVTSMKEMFYYCVNLKGLDISSLNTSLVTDMDEMFASCWSLESININNIDTSSVIGMYSMFSGCQSLEYLDLSSFDTKLVTDMMWMFQNCSSLVDLDVSNFDTRNVKRMNGMFSNCASLQSLDLSHFDTSSVTNMSNMFQACTSLSNLDLSSFNTTRVTDLSGMFQGCSSLKNLDLSDFDASAVTNTESMFGSIVYNSRYCGPCLLDSISWNETWPVDLEGAIPAPNAYNGKWWSVKDQAWFTPEEMAATRNGIADTYTNYEASPDYVVRDVTLYYRADNTGSGAANESSNHLAPARVTWSANWINPSISKLSSSTYNHGLAQTASVLASAAYDIKDDNQGGLNGDSAISYDLKELGFIPTSIKAYTPGSQGFFYDKASGFNPGYNRVGYIFGLKDNPADRSTIVAVIVRGTTGNGEWYSNFNLDSTMGFDITKANPSQMHEGFEKSAKQLEANLNTWITDQFRSGNLDGSENLRFIITGHSRGAAVANIVAKDLSSGVQVRGQSVGKDNVYAYTFATPAVTTGSTGTYDNIFNIINPEDYVPKAPLARWGYKRYGIDLALPSRSKMSPEEYARRHTIMQLYFKNGANRPHAVSGGGTAFAEAVDNTFYSYASNVWRYYHGSPSLISIGSPTAFQVAQLASKFMAGDYDGLKSLNNDDLLVISGFALRLLLAMGTGGLSALGAPSQTGGGIAGAAISYLMGTDRIDKAYRDMHDHQTYVAWMLSSDSAQNLYVNTNGLKLTVAATGGASAFATQSLDSVTVDEEAKQDVPVSFVVKDSIGLVVAEVKNGEVTDLPEGSSIVAYRTEKAVVVYIPGDASYSVEMTGEEGTTANVFSEEVTPLGEVVATASYEDVPLSSAPVCGSIPVNEEDAEDASIGLVLPDNTESTAIKTSSANLSYSEVSAGVEPDDAGVVYGTGSYLVGERVALSAVTMSDLQGDSDAEYIFVGWRDSIGTMVSSKETITVTAGDEGTFTAVFAEKQKIDMANVTVSVIPDQNLVGGFSAPEPTVSMDGVPLVKDVDYSLSYRNNTTVGDALVVITGKGSYAGEITVTFEIKASGGGGGGSIGGSGVGRPLPRPTSQATPSSPASPVASIEPESPKTTLTVDSPESPESPSQPEMPATPIDPADPTILYPEDRDYWIDRTGAGDWAVYRAGSLRQSTWIELNGNWYWMDKDGSMAVGWREFVDGWFFFNDIHDGTYGRTVSGWRCVDGHWYLFNTMHDGHYGRMLTGWQFREGDWYYLREDSEGPLGAMFENAWRDGYYLGEDGRMVRNAWIDRWHVGANGLWDATR